MKTLLTEFPETIHQELSRITRLIREAADPEFIILFGRYAGTPLAGAQGGYEMLVVTEREPALQPQELLRRVEADFPRSERTEHFLFLHCLSMQFVSGHVSQSLLLRTILSEGILLHDSRRFRYFRIRDFKPMQSYKKALENREIWHRQGLAHLATAQWTLSQGYARLAAGNLYLAAQAFLRCVELVCYGYQNPRTDLKTLCVLTIRFSEELGALFGFPDRFDRKFFQRLESFRRNTCTGRNFVLHAEAYQHVFEKVRQISGVTDQVCRAWLERLDGIRRTAGTKPSEEPDAAEKTQAHAIQQEPEAVSEQPEPAAIAGAEVSR